MSVTSTRAENPGGASSACWSIGLEFPEQVDDPTLGVKSGRHVAEDSSNFYKAGARSTVPAPKVVIALCKMFSHPLWLPCSHLQKELAKRKSLA